MYFVETSRSRPFRGNGWYSHFLVQHGLDCGLISASQITMEFLPSKVLKREYFQPLIDYLLKCFECEPDLQKLAVNAFVGMLLNLSNSVCHAKISLDESEAPNWYAEKDKEHSNLSDWNVFIKSRHLDNEHFPTLFIGEFYKDVVNQTTGYIIGKWVLEMEAMELHKMELLVESQGGVVLEVATDAVRYQTYGRKLNFKNYCCGAAKKVPKYRQDKNKVLKQKSHGGYRFHRSTGIDSCVDTQLPELFQLVWETYTDENDWVVKEEAQRIVASKKGININGSPGTGKTFTTKIIIGTLEEMNLEYEALAPTNTAARLIGRRTMDSFYNEFFKKKHHLFELLKTKDYIIIDEISMVHQKYYELLILIKKTYPDLKFIIVGDFAQFQPVLDIWRGDYASSPALHALCDGQRLQLNVCRRSEESGT